MKLDTATCVYKCSLYTVGGCIYKLGKFVMANWDVAGIYSEIYIHVYLENIYIQKGIYIWHIFIYSSWYMFRYTFIFRYIQIHIFRYTFMFWYIWRSWYIFRYIQPSMRIKYSRHTKCAAGMLILVIIDMWDMAALFLQHYAYCIYTAFQMLSKYFWKLGNGITCPW